MAKFRNWFEAVDIFGFTEKRPKESGTDDFLQRPIIPFDINLMMEFLAHKRIGLQPAENHFANEMQWGVDQGSVKLLVDTGYTFYVKRLAKDLQGENRWITKKMFQLNRQGYGGHEDPVAGEIFTHLETAYKSPVEGPIPDYHDLENLVVHVANKVRRVANEVLIYQSIKKVDENNYLIIFDVRGQGCEAPGQSRVEENLTSLTYDKEAGTIRITNYNVESPVGGPHSWSLMPNDLDLYFFPSQSRDEIAECVAVHFKYY